MRECPRCKYIVENENAKFCKNCGFKLPEPAKTSSIETFDETPTMPPSEEESNLNRASKENNKGITEEGHHADIKEKKSPIYTFWTGIILFLMITITIIVILNSLHNGNTRSAGIDTFDYIRDSCEVAVQEESETEADTIWEQTAAAEVQSDPENILYMNLSGYFEHEGKKYPVELEFSQDDGQITSCTYRNITYGGSISMQGERIGNNFTFRGKDGPKDFTISVVYDKEEQCMRGTARDGDIVLRVFLN